MLMSPVDIAPEITRVLDLNTTLDNLGGDPELLQEILEYFMEMAPQQMDQLQAAVESQDVEAVDLQAHSMKGGSANVGAVRLSAVARDLELLAKGGSLEGSVELYERMREEFVALEAVVPRIEWDSLD